MDTNGASFGQPIGVGGCHHHGSSQVIYLTKNTKLFLFCLIN